MLGAVRFSPMRVVKPGMSSERISDVLLMPPWASNHSNMRRMTSAVGTSCAVGVPGALTAGPR
jgi:hypothetical protein